MGFMSGGGFGVGWKHHHQTYQPSTADVKHDNSKPDIQQTQQIPQEEYCNDEQWDLITDKFINKIESDDFKQYINNLFNNLVDVDVDDYNCLEFVVTFGFKKDKIYFFKYCCHFLFVI